MRLALRIVAGAAILVVVLLAVLAIVIATIDTRTLIAPLKAELERASGRAVTLGGEARIGISLAPTLVLHDVAVANAPWGTMKEMIRAKRVEAQVELLPLLSRRVDIVRFTLVEPRILLETDARGRGNWVFGDAGKSSGAPSDPVGDAAGAFGLGEFAVENGTLDWRDGRSGEVTVVRIEKLQLRARDPAKPVVAEFRGAVGDVPLALEGHFGPLAALQARHWPWPVSVKGDVGGRKVEAQAKIRVEPDRIEATDVDYLVNASRLRGTLQYAARSPRPFVRFDLKGETVQASDLALAGGVAVAKPGALPKSGGTAPAAKQDGRLVPATPLPLAPLRALDAEGALAIDKLVLRDGRTLAGLRLRLQLVDGKLDVPEWRAAALGGTAQGRLVLDARSEKSSTLALRVDARGLDLATLMAVAGVKRDVQGGKTDVDLDVNARGLSLHDYVATLAGLVTVKVANARWESSTAGLPAALGQLVVSLNPIAAKGGTTELTCAAARLPFNGGVARVERGIAIETDQVGVSASGTIDLRNETLDLAIAPRVKARNLGDIAKIASAVRVQGSLAAPRVVVDPAGSVAAAIDLYALARGGRAALQGALSQPAPSGPGECAVALGARPAAASPSPNGQGAAPPRQNDPAQDLTRALEKLLKR